MIRASAIDESTEGRGFDSHLELRFFSGFLVVDSNVYNFLFIFIYIISSSGIIAVKIVGISLSGRQWNPRQGLVSG